MNAQEMFEAIGYRQNIENGYIKFENIDKCEVIEFDLEKKTIWVSHFLESKELNIDELKAMNKQCEELGWL